MKQIRFDTRDKKLKLYWLLIPVFAAGLVNTLLLRADPERFAPAACT